MRNAILIAAALLGGCVTPDMSDADRVAAAVTAAVAAEAAASVRCPKEGVELAAFVAGRVAFDLYYSALLTPIQANALATSRAATDRACGVVA